MPTVTPETLEEWAPLARLMRHDDWRAAERCAAGEVDYIEPHDDWCVDADGCRALLAYRDEVEVEPDHGCEFGDERPRAAGHYAAFDGRAIAGPASSRALALAALVAYVEAEDGWSYDYRDATVWEVVQ